MHEEFTRGEQTTAPSERNFGFVMSAVFLIVALWPLVFGQLRVNWWALAVAACFCALAVFWRRPLVPLNWLWMKFGLLLHAIISPVVLGLIYYVAVTPVGLLMRALGKDPLRLRREPGATSYWINRTPPGPTPDSMKNQF